MTGRKRATGHDWKEEGYWTHDWGGGGGYWPCLGGGGGKFVISKATLASKSNDLIHKW